MTDQDELLSSLRGMAERLRELHRQAVMVYTPIVDAILRSGSRDTGPIEHTLDGLLGHCGHEPALLLFKTLCRHYWLIDPVATAHYIGFYREMWDSDDAEPDAAEPELTPRDPAPRIP